MGFNGAGGTTRFAVGDRVFLSSDHSETSASANYQLTITSGYGVIEVISVNRAGSVPPVAGDALSGAAVVYNGSGSFGVDCYVNLYWQGVTFNLGSTGTQILLGSGGTKSHYFRNCALVFSTSNTGANLSTSNPMLAIFDNTTLQFNNAAQRVLGGGIPFEFKWLNTPTATLGTVPTTLFVPGNAPFLVTCRGVDLSAVTTTLFGAGAVNGETKGLLDSCRIASGSTRLASGTFSLSGDEVELVNCFDGTNILSERHTPAGDITTNRSTTLVGGAQDDVGLFSHQMVSSSRADPFAMTLDSFWMDVENTYTGSARTATVEIISSASLNNTDISLVLEYQGTAGSSLATLSSTLANALTASAAVATSSATWNSPPGPGTTWSTTDTTGLGSITNNNLTTNAAATQGAARSTVSASSGKYYWECTLTNASNTEMGIANSSANLANVASNGTNACWMNSGGQIFTNNVNTGTTLGARSNGDVICIALDAGGNLIWFRVGAAGNWNASGTANPATGVGGLSVSAIATTGFFALSAFTTNPGSTTANFGASAFTGAVPSGFTSGLGVVTPQHLQATFTPQTAGRVRGLVRLGKASTTCWINPQIIVT